MVETGREIRSQNPRTTMETLIPEVKGRLKDIQPIIDVAPEVVSHNMEPVKRLTSQVRIQDNYDRSLETLKYRQDGGSRTKSGSMIGLGETEKAISETMHEVRKGGVGIVTIGPYIQHSKKHVPVVRFITPEQCEKYNKIGLNLGSEHVESSPFVRSSYHAEKHIL